MKRLIVKNVAVTKGRDIMKEKRSDIQLWKIGYCPKGKYGGRIIIPSFNNNGRINYFISRSYVGHQRKYLNPSASKDFIFNELFIDWDEPVVLVEGVFDSIFLYCCGGIHPYDAYRFDIVQRDFYHSIAYWLYIYDAAN